MFAQDMMFDFSSIEFADSSSAFQFGEEDMVYRGCSIVQSSSCGVGCADYGDCQYLYEQPKVELKAEMPRGHPPLKPFHMTAENFETAESVNVIVERVNNYLLSKTKTIEANFSSYEFMWSGKFLFPCTPCNFMIRLFRLGSECSTGSKFAVEMQLVEGDRYSYSDLFCGLREQFIGGVSRSQRVFEMEFDFGDVENTVADSEEDLQLFEGSRDMKVVLLDALRDESAGFASKMEAYHIACSLFASGTSGVNGLDAELLNAMHAMTVNSPQYANLGMRNLEFAAFEQRFVESDIESLVGFAPVYQEAIFVC